MRSLLLTPGDHAHKLAEALASAADAVIIDLDVPAGRRETARANAAKTLADAALRPGGPTLVVRVSPLDSGETDRDLDAIAPGAPFATMLPRTRGAADVEQLSVKLALREALNGIDDGAIAIIAVLDTAEGLLAAAGLGGSSARLIGLVWDAGALVAELGAEAARDEAGALAAPLGTARDLTLFAAAAAKIEAIDAALAGASGADRLRIEAIAARRAGFVAKLALDPEEAAAINAVFADKK